MLPVYNVFLCSLIAVAMGTTVPPHKRRWGLTAIMAPIFTILGALELVYWLRTGDILTGPDTVVITELMKAYLLADLCYAAVVDFWRAPWIRHTAYFYVTNNLLATHYDGLIRPFLLAALPTAILAWGQLVPTLRADRLFGATFFLTRIAMPMAFVAPMRLPTFLWSVIGIALTAHVYWFSRWIASQTRRNAATD
jgi:hypothetical protein